MDRKANDKFDDFYDIRLALPDDVPHIMKFIDEHWKHNHIMAVNRELFEYEYVHADEVDFVIAVKKTTDTIEAIFGFLRCTRYRTGDIWGSMWKVNDEGDNVGLLGIELAKRVYSLTGCKSHIGNGANPETTIPIRRTFFRERVGKMKQYYWLNPYRSDYSIAIIKQKWIPKKQGGLSYQVKVIQSFEQLEKEFQIQSVGSKPYKDMWYINHRFFQHPIYHYNVYGILDEGRIKAVFVTKKIEIKDSSILRIVDYIGDHNLIKGLYEILDEWVRNSNYEYVDFYEFGISDTIMTSAGFKDREEYDNIIPNYFEPFVQENIDIWVHYKEEGTTFFKADGDQDRPNLL